MENENDILFQKKKKRKLIYQVLTLIQVIITALYVVFFIQLLLEQNKSKIGDILPDPAIMAFNSRFTSYEGTHIRGAQINQLIQLVVDTNTSYNNENIKINISYVESDGRTITEEITNNNKKVKTYNTYTVNIEYSKEGYVNKIIIVENN